MMRVKSGVQDIKMGAMMDIKRRCVALSMASVLILTGTFTGCAGKKSKDKGDWYNAKTVKLELRFDQAEYESLYSSFVGIAGDKAVVSVSYQKLLPSDFDYVKDDISEYQGDTFEIYDLDGKYIKSYLWSDIQEQEGIQGFPSGRTGVAGDKIVIPTLTYDASNDSSVVVYYFDIESGKITGSYDNGQTGQYLMEYISSGGYNAFLYGKFGDYESARLDIVSEDSSVKTIELKGENAIWTESWRLIEMGDAKILVPFTREGADKNHSMGFFAVDLKTATCEEITDDLEWAGGYSGLYSASYVDGNGSLSSDEDGLFKFDMNAKTTERILDYDRCNANLYMLRNMKLYSTEGDKYVFAGEYFMDDYMKLTTQSAVVILEKAAEDPTAGKQEITLASFDTLDYQTAEAVLVFNEGSGGYHISYDPQYNLDNFMDSAADPDTADLQAKMALLDKIKIDIQAGEGPDIIMNGLPYTVSLDSSLFMDLSGSISSDDLFGNVIDACKTDGKLYNVPLTFNVAGICTDSSKVEEGQTGFTYDEYKEFVSSVCNGNDPIEMEQTEYFLNCYCLMGSRFTGANGAPDFSSDELTALAEYVHDNVYYIAPPEEEIEIETVDEDNSAVYTEFHSIMEYIGYFDHVQNDLVVLGMPSSDRLGPSLKITNSVAVSASTDCKDGCLEFAKSLLTDGVQEGYGKNALNTPVNIAAYETSSSAMIAQYNKLRETMISIGMNAYELKQMGMMCAVDENAIANYAEIIKTASVVIRSDPAIAMIVREEIPAYLGGQKSLDEVVEIINNRVNTYVSERSK